jgi:hypothetical protein
VKRIIVSLTYLAILLLFAMSTSMAEENIELDTVDIGEDEDEEYYLSGWGPPEPKSHGGNWGGIESIGSESIDKKCRVVYFENYSEEDPDLASAVVTLYPHSGSSRKIIMRVLDGIADDSFKVSVMGKHGNWVEIGSYNADNDATNEFWMEHEFEIPVKEIKAGRPLQVKIEATETSPKWWGFNTYGQLAVDWIELWGNGSR